MVLDIHHHAVNLGDISEDDLYYNLWPQAHRGFEADGSMRRRRHGAGWRTRRNSPSQSALTVVWKHRQGLTLTVLFYRQPLSKSIITFLEKR
ncbi:hypothetical protein [Paenibacillus sp. Soil522]|uniref:hypothetical protein n=1 Tax=Paenibacillus sp. Soil522 TaxID=1736388 RepID=UPI0022862AA2|nr:hypothetical protein [Paenibacillus sp. Soil522]